MVLIIAQKYKKKNLGIGRQSCVRLELKQTIFVNYLIYAAPRSYILENIIINNGHGNQKIFKWYK